MWNIGLNPDLVTPNDVALGHCDSIDLSKPSTQVVTGGNSTGKTSGTVNAYTKGIITAQSLCIAPATEFTLTPVQEIVTCMKTQTVESEGHSLLAHNLHRARKIFAVLEQDGFKFVALDEPCSGATKAQLSSAIAYEVIKRIGLTKGVLCITTTHIPEPTALAAEFPQSFSNIRSTSNYRIEPGIGEFDKEDAGIEKVEEILGSDFASSVKESLSKKEELLDIFLQDSNNRVRALEYHLKNEIFDGEKDAFIHALSEGTQGMKAPDLKSIVDDAKSLAAEREFMRDGKPVLNDCIVHDAFQSHKDKKDAETAKSESPKAEKVCRENPALQSVASKALLRNIPCECAKKICSDLAIFPIRPCVVIRMVHETVSEWSKLKSAIESEKNRILSLNPTSDDPISYQLKKMEEIQSALSELINILQEPKNSIALMYGVVLFSDFPKEYTTWCHVPKVHWKILNEYWKHTNAIIAARHYFHHLHEHPNAPYTSPIVNKEKPIESKSNWSNCNVPGFEDRTAPCTII